MPSYHWQDKLEREGKDPFQEQSIEDDWRIVGDGVPDILFCGSEQKKHFVIRLFLSFGFIFNILQNRFSLQPLLICYLQKYSFKPAKILDESWVNN